MSSKLEELYKKIFEILEYGDFYDITQYLNGYLSKDGFRITDHSYNIAMISAYMNKEKTALYTEILMITGLKILVMCKEVQGDGNIHCIPFAYPPTSIISSAK